jgi:putative membrane protein
MSLGVWSADPSVYVGVAAMTTAYFYGIRRTLPGGISSVSRWRIASFLGGMLSILLALVSPLHDLADNYLFSAHMAQHLLMTLIAPPLILIGLPGEVLRPLLRSWLVRDLLDTLTKPLPAYFLFNLIFAASHLPAFYDLTLRDHRVHILEHWVFMVAATITWWPIFSPLREYPRLPYPLQLLYLFFQTFSGFIVGAILTLAPQPIYALYAQAPRVSRLSPLEDQQLGGLLMWVVASLYLLAVLTVIFFIWANKEEHRGNAPVSTLR